MQLSATTWILIMTFLAVILYHHTCQRNNSDPNMIIFIQEPAPVKQDKCITTRTDPNASDYMSLRKVYGPLLVPNDSCKVMASNDRESWRFHDTGIDHMLYTKSPPCFYPAMDPELEASSGRSMWL